MPLTIDAEPGTIVRIRTNGQEIAIKLEIRGGQIRATILEAVAGLVLVEKPPKPSLWLERVAITPLGEAYCRQAKAKSAASH